MLVRFRKSVKRYIDVVTDHPGLSLFHCHQQFHMEMGFMALMQYEEG